MKQDSTETQADERPVPGATLARRLFSRGATRASVGPRASFYHRLGLDDPYADAVPEGGAPDGPFTYLSSAAYFRDLRRSRLGLLSRIEGKQSTAGRLGSRLRAVGPAAAEVRTSVLARLGLGEDDFTVLETEAAEEEEEETSLGYRIVPRAPRARRDRPARRPAAAAMHREGAPATGDDLSAVLERLLAGFRGRERDRVREVLVQVAAEPPAQRERAARAIVRDLRGPARAMARLEAGAVEEAGDRPTQIAAGRAAVSRPSKGLKRILGASPAVLVLEQAPEEAVEAETEVRRVTRRVQAPGSAPRVPRRASSAREAARTQQASGRAGPSTDAVLSAAPVARSASRRPTQRMAARAQRALATPSFMEGAAPRAVRAIRARETLLERSEAGIVDALQSAAPLARAATGYVRRRRDRAPDAVLPVAEPSSEDESVEAVASLPAPRPRAVPARRTVPPTRRALDRADAAREATAPARGPRVTPRVASLASPAPVPSEQGASLASPARRSARPRPTAHVASARAERSEQRVSPMAARPRRRMMGPSLLLALPAEAEVELDEGQAPSETGLRRPRALPRRADPSTPAARAAVASATADAGPSMAQRVRAGRAEPMAPVVRAAERVERAATPAARVPRRSLVPQPAAYLMPEQAEAVEGEPEVATVPSRRTRRAQAPTVTEAVTVATPSRAEASTPTARRLLARADAQAEAPVRRAARRAVAPAAAAPRQARRRVLPAAVAYLEATEESVVETSPSEPLPRRSRRRPTAPVATTRRSRPARAAEAPVVGARPTPRESMPTGATEVPRAGVGSTLRPQVVTPSFEPRLDDEVDESPTVRAARRRLARPELAAASPTRLAEVPTSYLDAVARPDDALDEDGLDAPLARPAARAAQRAVAVVSTDGSGRVLTAGSPVAYASASERALPPLSDAPVVLSSPAAERLARLDAPSPSTPRAMRRSTGPTPVLVAPASEEAPQIPEATPPRRRRRVRPLATPPAARGIAPTVARPSAPAPVARRSGPGSTARVVERSVRAADRAAQQLAPAPVRRFDWAAVVASIAPTLSPRKVRQVLGSDALDTLARPDIAEVGESAPAVAPRRARRAAPGRPLALREVAERTREAVHALGRTERSVLTFDAARRTFGDASGREHTVVARVEQGADGRVRRVRASRPSSGEQVLLAPESVDELLPPFVARPSQASWVEERATVGRASSRSRRAPTTREAPGARLVERSAAPDPVQRSPRRRPRAVEGAPTRAPATARAMPSAPSGLRPAPVVGLGAMTLAEAALPAVVADEAELGSTPGRRSPAMPAAARALEPMAVRRATDDADGAPTAARRSLRATVGQVASGTASTPTGRRRARARARAQVGAQLTRRVDERTAGVGARRGATRGTASVLSGDVGSLPTGITHDEASEVAARASTDASTTPGWARRAHEGTSVAVRPEVPEFFLRPRLRTSAGGLLPALARAGDPEEVVRVILERSHDAGDLSMLPVAAQRLLHRVSDEAHQVAASARGERGRRHTSTAAPRMADTVRTEVLQPVQVLRPGSPGSAVTQQGVGSSKVMKLANKLMKLIHLAESNGRGDAHKHVRMAEDSAAARAEGGADGLDGGASGEDKRMNINALREDVLQAVLMELEDMSWRREESNGPSIWC